MTKVIIRQDVDGTWSVWDAIFTTGQYTSGLRDVAAARLWIERTYPGAKIVVKGESERVGQKGSEKVPRLAERATFA